MDIELQPKPDLSAELLAGEVSIVKLNMTVCESNGDFEGANHTDTVKWYWNSEGKSDAWKLVKLEDCLIQLTSKKDQIKAPLPAPMTVKRSDVIIKRDAISSGHVVTISDLKLSNGTDEFHFVPLENFADQAMFITRIQELQYIELLYRTGTAQEALRNTATQPPRLKCLVTSDTDGSIVGFVRYHHVDTGTFLNKVSQGKYAKAQVQRWKDQLKAQYKCLDYMSGP
ncbi:hypothetical protein FPQ18DRAFT_385487 [Pyronema domesticum]|uniref:Uncharacterized protein n=1 Tax=Pyronema omphalodes (strain CBS 100304) TaxID=1076935 RepID=U4LAR6_PYROM|nr:hypothetical protein FPQ18DRAFT_385487 [Pyronema domesticum]CCX15439.1 Protein of unknown function [Pyronema omphalodes CBS 100304]